MNSKLFFLLSLIFCLSCTDKHDFDINGHWHVQKSKVNSLIKTIDFDDEFVELNKNVLGYSLILDHDLDQSIIRGGACVSTILKYTQINDSTVYLKDQFTTDSSRKDLIAFKCTSSNCCNMQEEFFQNRPVNIDLPVSDKKVNYGLYPISLSANIFIGRPKVKSTYEYKMVLSGEFGVIKDLGNFFEKHKEKVPGDNRHLIRCLIYADKNTPREMINPVINFCEKSNIRVVLVGRKNDYSNGLELVYSYLKK